MNAVRAYLAVPGTIRGVPVNESLKNTHANPIGDDDNVDMALHGNYEYPFNEMAAEPAPRLENHLRGSHHAIDVQSRNPFVLVRERS